MIKDSPFSDLQLLNRISNDDQKAFTVLFERYRNHIFNYLFKVTKSNETSEEIVLDVFLKIWQGRSLLNEIDNFEAFLFCIARNKAIDFLRWLEKRKSEQIELWNQVQQSIEMELADSNISLRETQEVISNAVTQLSPQRKMAFELSREHGLTYDQIAKRMNISSNTVKNHIAASLQFIRFNISTIAKLIVIFLLVKQ